METGLVNHIVFVIDASGSMNGLQESVVQVFDTQIQYLSRRSQELNQETRVSVYLFNQTTTNLVYDKDVMRLPSLAGQYSPNGGTALLDGTIKALEDLQHTPQIYGDHAFLLYIITDGEEMDSKKGAQTKLNQMIAALPNHWTLAVLVPNQQGVFEAKKFGFPANNIQIWNTTVAGVETAGTAIQAATEGFLTNRQQGIRGTTNLFNIDLSTLTSAAVTQTLTPLTVTNYTLYPVTTTGSIKALVEGLTGTPFKKGSTYYQLSKPEMVQKTKQICIQDKTTHQMFTGPNARTLIGLPTAADVMVKPSALGNFDIYVESTSVNRKLLANTNILVM